MKFSYIIPHRTSTLDRKRNLDYVISYLNNNFNNIEIIVIEQDTEEKYFNVGCKKLLYVDSGPFKRAACLNYGFKNSAFNKIIFADNDLLIPHTQIIEALSKLEEYGVVNPYRTVRDLNEEITNKLVQIDNFSVLTTYTERGGIVFSGGACCFTKEAYFTIAGYDEQFIGWGGEDNACTHKILNLLKYYEVDGHCWHMNHDRNMSNDLHEDYLNNIKTLHMIEGLSGNKLIKYCTARRKQYGW